MKQGGKHTMQVRYLALLAAAMLMAAGCGKTESSQKLYQEAQQYHAKGDDKAAIIQLKNALQKNADNAEARYLLGVIYNDTHDPKSAEKELRHARRLGYKPGDVQLAVGRSLMGQGEFQRALDEVQPLPDAARDVQAGILSLRGNAQLALQQPGDARKSFDAAVQIQPGFADALLGQARLAAGKGDAAEAMRLVEQALEGYPGNTEVGLFKGDLLRAQAKTAEAIAAYRQVLTIDPNNTGAHLSLASMHVASGDFAAARTEIQALQKVSPNNPLARYLGAMVDFREGKYPQARDALQEVLKRVPDHMPAVLLSGAVAFALGSYEQAEADLTRFLKRFPGNSYARKLLAATELKTGRAQNALETLKPLQSDDRPDPQVLALTGEAYAQSKDFAAATGYFEKAAALAPKSAALRTQLALSHLAGGDSQRAVTDLQSAAELDPQQSRADTLLVITHLSRKEYDKALQAIADLEKKQPNSPDTLNLKAAAYLGKQDMANARKSLEQALVLKPDFYPAAANLAQLDIRDNKPEAARKRFEGILKNAPGNVEAMLALADLAGRAGQEKEYLEWLQKAAKTSPSVLRPRLLIARYYLNKKDPQKALAMAREAQSANLNNPDALNMLGTAQLAAGEKDNALVSFKQLTQLAPKSAEPHLRVAQAQAAMKDNAAALASANKALELQPDFADAEIFLFSLQLQADHPAEALTIARKVQKQSPKAALGYAMEGDALMQQKQFKDAAKVYETAFSSSRSGPLAVKLHAAYSQAGDAKTGEAKLAQYIKDSPQDMVARLYLANAYLRSEQHKAAIGQYEALLKQDAKNLLALNNLAWLYQQEKSPRALDYAEQAYKVQPDNAPVLDTLGWILVEQGKTARGLELLQKATSKQPDAPEIRYHLAAALAKSGDNARARQELERVLAAGVAFPQEKEAQALLKQLQSRK
jgi:putative PEP-CTERM system TPR-repeat lipoprotein